MRAGYARRTQAGAPVVHGIHAVLWALEQVADEADIQGLKVRFAKFIHLDMPVTLERASAGGDVLKTVHYR